MPRTIILIACLLLTATAYACNIPVFRYALERWKPDACEVVIYHGGFLADDQEGFVSELKKSKHINVVMDDKTLNKEEGEPHAVVRCQVIGGEQVNVWQGKLNDLPKLNLTTSPARTELQRRLVKGDAVVWLLIESADVAKNKAVEAQLEKRFKFLASKIELPEGIGLPGSELFSDVPLLLQFSILKIDTNDPKEKFLVRLLTPLQREAFEAGEPLVVPVFGRGRALEVLPANELSDQLIDDLTVFLSGACSCQVKERNPGFDLLISANWDEELFGVDGEAPADDPLHQQNPQQPKLLAIPPGRTK
ncbi:MAG: hypothetical protein WBD20_25710 [Pirellulaceae bacterium]